MCRYYYYSMLYSNSNPKSICIGILGDQMFEFESERSIFKIKTILFSDYPFDVKNCIHVTFRDCKKDIDLKGFTKQEFTTLVIDLTQDLDIIWENISKSSRRDINRAKNDGIDLKINANYEEFYEINKQFREKKGIGSYSIDIKFMKKNGTLFTVCLEGEIIGGYLFLEDKENIISLISASKRLGVSKEKARISSNANKLIIWESIKYAKNKGIKEYDFGGYYTGKEPDQQKENINIFKNGFGGKLVTHYIYQKDYSKIFKVARGLCSKI